MPWLQIGLTATPVRNIDHNTFQLFGCEDRNPTASYDFREAVESAPPYLVPFEVMRHTTKFLREGIKYSQMSEAQRAALEAGDNDPDSIEYDAAQVDKQIFNRDTTRQILRNLMENGLRVKDGTRLGKTIVFARNHLHALHLAEVFAETFPQYGGGFCRVIDNQEPKAEQLIDDLKDPDKDPVIAVSVDMLDTGIDIPEVLNLVFAKPIKSYVKFWQMIGRGTRLCPDLLGPGQPKTTFLIIDHWGNFEFFSEKYVEKDIRPPKSLLQQLFEARVALAAAALEAMDRPLFERTVDLLLADLGAVRAVESFSVRDRWRELELLAHRDLLLAFAASTRADLLSIAAPLMQWRSVRGDEKAYAFDLLSTQLELELARGSARADDLRAGVEDQVELLLKGHPAVQAKGEAIARVRSKDFWKTARAADVDALREELRGVMQHQGEYATGHVTPRLIDVADGGARRDSYIPKLEGTELMAYRERVLTVLHGHFETNPTLRKIKAREPVDDGEVEALARLLLEVDDKANLSVLAAHQPETRQTLVHVLRGLVGVDAAAVEQAFTTFAQEYPRLSSQQLKFLQMLKNHLVKNGGISLERLYEAPFTQLHADGVEGVFPENAQRTKIQAILDSFELPPPSKRAS